MPLETWMNQVQMFFYRGPGHWYCRHGINTEFSGSHHKATDERPGEEHLVLSQLWEG